MAKEARHNADNAREIRRKRRIRNQIIAYLVLVILLAGIGYGGYMGVRYLYGKVAKPQEQVQVSENDTQVSENEPGIITTPTDITASENETVSENTTEEVSANAAVMEYIASMTIEQKVANLFIVTPIIKN